MPRAYRMSLRSAAADETRARLIEGARELLISESGFRNFTIDAIAKHVGVARMTVYNQFRSKAGIFEALADDLAARGKIASNAEAAFRCEDAREGLVKLLDAFVHFWLNDPEVFRKLHALSMLDPESHAAQREAWHREALQTMLGRVRRHYRLPSGRAHERSVDGAVMLSSFAACDSLARRGLSERQVAKRVRELVGACIGLELDLTF